MVVYPYLCGLMAGAQKILHDSRVTMKKSILKMDQPKLSEFEKKYSELLR